MVVEKYQEFLAAQVLNEDRVVNYRLLSRAQKVHVNTAKQMLYEFHRAQNARKPDSVHATYLISGVQKTSTTSLSNGAPHLDGDDSFMKDSFTMSSSMPGSSQPTLTQPSITYSTFTLVPQEFLDKVKSSYDSIHMIHVYSLEPGPLTDIELASDCNRKVRNEYDIKDEALDSRKGFGTIWNPAAMRRPRKIAPPIPAEESKPVSKPFSSSKLSAAAAQQPAPKAAAERKPPQLKKESSSLFKSFSKTKPVTRKPDEDSPMRDVENDDEEDTGEMPTQEQSRESKEQAEARRKEKQEREDQLKKMMEDDANEVDEEMQDRLPGEESDPADEGEEEADEVLPPPPSPPKEEEPTETVAGGRRRGRRRVMKKKTFKDAEGYFVTKEEPVWESFSESEGEPAPKKTKPSGPAALATNKTSQTTKKASRPGQGSIMSFFGKK